MIPLFWRMTLPRERTRREIVQAVIDLRSLCARFGFRPTEQTTIWQRPLHTAEAGPPHPLFGPRTNVPRIACYPVHLRNTGQLSHTTAYVHGDMAVWFDAATTIGSFSVGFARFPLEATCHDPLEPDREIAVEPPADWTGTGWIDLAPATDPRGGSLLHGLGLHLCLIAWLDAVRHTGIGLHVDDSTGYWPSRDPERLRQSMVDALTHEAKSIGAWKDQEPNVVIANEIIRRPDFERLEMSEAPALPDDWRTTLAELIDLTAEPPGDGA